MALGQPACTSAENVKRARVETMRLSPRLGKTEKLYPTTSSSKARRSVLNRTKRILACLADTIFNTPPIARSTIDYVILAP